MHSLSDSLGGINPTLHHGTLNAILLPAVVRFNRGAETVAREDKIARLQQAMGLSASQSVEEALVTKSRALNLPTGLGELGVTEALYERTSRARWRTTATVPTRVKPVPTTTWRCCGPLRKAPGALPMQ